MREAFLKYTTDDRVGISDGTFDKTGVESGWADLIVIAQVYPPEPCGHVLKSVARHFTGVLTTKPQQPSLLEY
ncbi:hypothetical protein C8R44DRAFT_819059 [Mycena epipterygia]|nr:hypothetical protein C8R44DRAFT_819059 [Mycena epipterygia]